MVHAQAQPNDYLSKIAFDAGVLLKKLAADNFSVLKDRDPAASLAGLTLRICGASTGAVPPAAQPAPRAGVQLGNASSAPGSKLDLAYDISTLYIAASPQSFSARSRKVRWLVWSQLVWE